MRNLIGNAVNFNLVIYTNYESSQILKEYNGKQNIKIVIREVEEFSTYKYENYWLQNHHKNTLLKNTDHRLNMIWSEKINFVLGSYKNQYFYSEFYGWCDIGYFRNRECDLRLDNLNPWPSETKLKKLSSDLIYYGLANNKISDLQNAFRLINDKNANNLPATPLPLEQTSISGGFFISHHKNLEWWQKTYSSTLINYLTNNALVKDDQLILADCIFSNLERFNLIYEDDPQYDNWFLFQRFLSS
jgi:hypothetical protein